MKYSKIKKLIESIGEREIVNHFDESLLCHHFTHPAVIAFLAKMVCRGQSFKMYIHDTLFREVRFKGLRLHKKGGKWYFGYYHQHSKHHFSNFMHFFSFIRRGYPLYFTDMAGNILFSQYMPYTTRLAALKAHIDKINEDYTYLYKQDFLSVLARFANTHIKLKIIVADCKGDFYVTYSKIWTYDTNYVFCLRFENTRLNARLPDYINEGHYIGMDKKIVQIQYKNKVLYSTKAFTETEMDERDDYLFKATVRFLVRL